MGKPELTDDQFSVLVDAAELAFRTYKPSDPKIEEALVSAVSVITDYLEAVQYVGTNPEFQGYEGRRKWWAAQSAKAAA